jgi:hypothetical protein
MTSATDRFKLLLVQALERVCILEAELEQTQAELEELRREQAETQNGSSDSRPMTSEPASMHTSADGDQA